MFSLIKNNLIGKMLIAMPSMRDQRFMKSVIFVCEHSPKGAMGIIVNKPVSDENRKGIIDSLGLTRHTNAHDIPVHIGGPVEYGKGIVLHSNDYVSGKLTRKVNEHVSITTSFDIFADIANDSGPNRFLLTLGYAGWGAGQLELELQNNGWLVCHSSPALVFSPYNKSKWDAALRTLGIDALVLAQQGGQA